MKVKRAVEALELADSHPILRRHVAADPVGSPRGRVLMAGVWPQDQNPSQSNFGAAGVYSHHTPGSVVDLGGAAAAHVLLGCPDIVKERLS